MKGNTVQDNVCKEQPEGSVDNSTDNDEGVSVGLILEAVFLFLTPFFAETFAKRIVTAILLAAKVSVKEVVKLTGMGRSTVYNFKKEIYAATSRVDASFKHPLGQSPYRPAHSLRYKSPSRWCLC